MRPFANLVRTLLVWPFPRILLLCLLPTLLSGCGQDDGTNPVSGSVQFDGKPVPMGVIFFDPNPSKGNDGRQGFAEIVDGQFNTADGGRGTTGGAYIARIRGFHSPDGTPRRLFLEYKVEIDLPPEATTQNFQVPASAAKGMPAENFDPP